jgi:hypothetical protein
MKKGFWIVVALLIASVAMNVWFWQTEPEPSIVIERDTVWKDSIIREPVPAETINTERVVYLRIPVPGPGDTITLHDSIDVPIPIMQKRYDDSLYTAWVSGYEPNLDSIDLRLPTITETVTKTIVKPSPLITVGLHVGGGYGVFNRKPDIYVGVGAQVNLWRK